MAVGIAWLALRKAARRAGRYLDGRLNRPKTPELYPGLSDEELAQPFDREMAQALEEALRVRLTTLRGSDAVSEPVAFYLTRVLYRDLMLVPGVSACLAPEWRERAPSGPDEVDGDFEPSAWVLGGELSLTEVEAGGSAREQDEAGGSAREQKNDSPG